MSDSMTKPIDTGGGGFGQSKPGFLHRHREKLKRLTAGLVASGLVFSLGVGTAMGIGSGGGGTSVSAGASGGAATNFWIATSDAWPLEKMQGKTVPNQGWDQQSINMFVEHFKKSVPWATYNKTGIWWGDYMAADANQACNDAGNRAKADWDAQHPEGPKAEHFRVVQMGIAGKTSNGRTYYMNGAAADTWRHVYNDLQWPVTEYDNLLGWNKPEDVAKVPARFNEQIVNNRRLICVAVSEHEPGGDTVCKEGDPTWNPVTKECSQCNPNSEGWNPETGTCEKKPPEEVEKDIIIETNVGPTFDKAGGEQLVYDNISVTNYGYQGNEEFQVVVRLNWESVEDGGNKVTRHKDKLQKVTTSWRGKSENFRPEDFGWKTWQAGRYWYDVYANTSDHFAFTDQPALRPKNVTDTVDHDPEEMWDAGPVPVVKIITRQDLHTHGDANIGPDRLNDGDDPNIPLSADKEDLLTDHRYTATSNMAWHSKVSAHTNGFYSRMYMTDIIDVKDRNVCIGQRKELTVSPAGTTGAACDDVNQVYVTDLNGSIVNRDFITFNIDRSQADKVIVSALVDLTRITDGTKSGYFTLHVPTYAPVTGLEQPITDTGNVCWGTPGDWLQKCTKSVSWTVDTKVPDPNKLWTLENGALNHINTDARNTGEDANRDNNQGVDNMTFASGHQVLAVVNGRIPANLAESLEKYELVDDLSTPVAIIPDPNHPGDARYNKTIYPSDILDINPKDVRVFADAVDVTNSFNISFEKNSEGKLVRIVARANNATDANSFISSTRNIRDRDRLMKLVIPMHFGNNYDFKTITRGKNLNDKDTLKIVNGGWEMFNDTKTETNTPPIFTTTPDPDKVWASTEEGALRSYDDTWSNAVNKDEKVFLPGEDVYSVVNGRIPAHLGRPLEAYSLTDDWHEAKPYINFTDPTRVKIYFGKNVYSADSSTRIDVTNEFNITVDAESGKTIAVAKPEFLKRTGGEFTVNKAGLPYDTEVRMVIGGTFYTRQHGDGPNIPYDTNGETVKFFNHGLECWNGTDPDGERDTVNGGPVGTGNCTPTNDPGIFTWTPDPHKMVVSNENESIVGGSNNGTSPVQWGQDINGYHVYPGQQISYKIMADFRIPSNTARGLLNMKVDDYYDANFEPNTDGIMVYDRRYTGNGDLGRLVLGRDFTVSHDTVRRVITINFTKSWIESNQRYLADNADDADGLGTNTTYNAEDRAPKGSAWQPGNYEWNPETNTMNWKRYVEITLTGRIKKNLGANPNGDYSATPAGGFIVRNQAAQCLNGSCYDTEIPEVKVPGITPDKDVLRTTDKADIDGKTLLLGDKILYRLTLDAGVQRAESAYDVHKLGMVDDYDEEYLDLTADKIKVTDKATGEDYTKWFNIQVKDGKAYIFAKQNQVSSISNFPENGEYSDTDLAAYDKAVILRGSPIIDQRLLGKEFYIDMEATVIKDADKTITNQGIQNIENSYYPTKIVSNPVKPIQPTKDVVVDERSKDKSIDGTIVKNQAEFNYRLNSSVLPANRAYPMSQWSIDDTFDIAHDKYLGIWAAYANTNIMDPAKQCTEVKYAKGDFLADDILHEDPREEIYFTTTYNEQTGAFHIEATQHLMDLINGCLGNEAAWSIYTKMQRIAPTGVDENGDLLPVVNKFTETHNNFPRETNEVKTYTPENAKIDVEKYDERTFKKEGFDKADRDRAEDALELNMDQETGTNVPETILIKVTNTGEVDLKDVKLSDVVPANRSGMPLSDIVCFRPLSELDDKTRARYLNDKLITESDEWYKVPGADLGSLKVGQRINCEGTLNGVLPGTYHENTVTAEGTSVPTGNKVSDKDPFFAKLKGTTSIDIEKYTLDEGLTKGDRDKIKEAYPLTDEDLNRDEEKPFKIGFQITNTGNVPLERVTMSDTLWKNTTGTIAALTCDLPVDETNNFVAVPTGNTLIDGNTRVNSPTGAVENGRTDAGVNPTHGDTTTTGALQGGETVVTNDPSRASLPTGTTNVVDVNAHANYLLQLWGAHKAALGNGFDVNSIKTKTTLLNAGLIGTMLPGQKINCTGILVGVAKDSYHSDTAEVIGYTPNFGYPVVPVTDNDDWHGKHGTPTNTPDKPVDPTPTTACIPVPKGSDGKYLDPSKLTQVVGSDGKVIPYCPVPADNTCVDVPKDANGKYVDVSKLPAPKDKYGNEVKWCAIPSTTTPACVPTPKDANGKPVDTSKLPAPKDANGNTTTYCPVPPLACVVVPPSTEYKAGEKVDVSKLPVVKDDKTGYAREYCPIDQTPKDCLPMPKTAVGSDGKIDTSKLPVVYHPDGTALEYCPVDTPNTGTPTTPGTSTPGTSNPGTYGSTPVDEGPQKGVVTGNVIASANPLVIMGGIMLILAAVGAGIIGVRRYRRESVEA